MTQFRLGIQDTVAAQILDTPTTTQASTRAHDASHAPSRSNALRKLDGKHTTVAAVVLGGHVVGSQLGP
jgi:hypothetical protein